MIASVNIIFQAYIPNNLGKPLIEYFRNNIVFNDESIENYSSFKQQVESVGGNWAYEPGSYKTFFRTDNIGFEKHYGAHTARLKIEGRVDLSKVGRYLASETTSIFYDRHNGESRYASRQHSDESSQVTAYIFYPQQYMSDTSGILTSQKFMGIFEPPTTLRAAEKDLVVTLKNELTGSFFVAPGTRMRDINDTTVINVSASAGYPYNFFAPDINFNLEIRLYRLGNSVAISFVGIHDEFPAYELIVDNQLIYSYDPLSNGFTGPNLYNLNKQNIFNKVALCKIPVI